MSKMALLSSGVEADSRPVTETCADPTKELGTAKDAVDVAAVQQVLAETADVLFRMHTSVLKDALSAAEAGRGPSMPVVPPPPAKLPFLEPNSEERES